MPTLQDLEQAVPTALAGVDLPGLGPKVSGKVRDLYLRGDRRIMVVTDRVSAFDRVLGVVPCKGQVLNQLSAWWFERTRDLVPNHLVAVPDPNVTVALEADPLPVEVVVRGRLTGVTDTSLWTRYARGERRPYGLDLPEGLRRNDALPSPVITPTTKGAPGQHDEPVSREQILERGLVDPALWEEVERAALALFERGRDLAARGGLVLVDTKYEFGLVEGRLHLIDEVHTPDSSRYWIAGSWSEGTEPESLDKEYLRAWYAGQGYRGEGEPPPLPADLAARLAARYIECYERLTGEPFRPAPGPAAERIARSLREASLL